LPGKCLVSFCLNFTCAANRLQIYAQPFGFANLFFRLKESQLKLPVWKVVFWLKLIRLVD